jgi:hypothetical protein
MSYTKIEQTPSKQLAPCMFCGGEGRLFVHELAGVPELEPYYQVECGDCGATGPARDNPFHAESWWNGEMLSQAVEDRERDS